MYRLIRLFGFYFFPLHLGTKQYHVNYEDDNNNKKQCNGKNYYELKMVKKYDEFESSLHL